MTFKVINDRTGYRVRSQQTRTVAPSVTQFPYRPNIFNRGEISQRGNRELHSMFHQNQVVVLPPGSPLCNSQTSGPSSFFGAPTNPPSAMPTTRSPTVSAFPTISRQPSGAPSSTPSLSPSGSPSIIPTTFPSAGPTLEQAAIIAAQKTWPTPDWGIEQDVTAADTISPSPAWTFSPSYEWTWTPSYQGTMPPSLSPVVSQQSVVPTVSTSPSISPADAEDPQRTVASTAPTVSTSPSVSPSNAEDHQRTSASLAPSATPTSAPLDSLNPLQKIISIPAVEPLPRPSISPTSSSSSAPIQSPRKVPSIRQAANAQPTALSSSSLLVPAPASPPPTSSTMPISSAPSTETEHESKNVITRRGLRSAHVPVV